MAISYSFVSHWQTQAPITDAWDAILLSTEWPQWWSDVITVEEIKTGDEQGIGSIRNYTLKSPMLYKLTFSLLLTDRIDYKLLTGQAGGELEGTGTWQFEEIEGATHIKCYWNVHTNIAWMNRFAFLLKPLFRHNHKAVMNSGAKCLANKLGTPVTVV